ncbi:MAG: BamA/TamA family outer membrane protein [Neisseriaceae bacterium]|nr:BamA/TamA family outer membrane protein [Neisseriaceae bacterium]
MLQSRFSLLMVLLTTLSACAGMKSPQQTTATDVHPATSAENPENSSPNIQVAQATENTKNSSPNIQAAQATENARPASNGQTPRREFPEQYQVNIRVDTHRYATTDLTLANSLQSLLQEHLTLVNKRRLPDLDEDQMEYLLQETHTEVEQILNTQGFFKNTVAITPKGKNYQVDVRLGNEVKVSSVNIELRGDIEQDEQISDFYAEALLDWNMPFDSRFTQSAWSTAKAKTLALIAKRKYPKAKITQSKALIDGNAGTADLTLIIDSQPAVVYGAMTVEGTQRYPESVIRNLSILKEGDFYDIDKISEYQQSLEQDGHYGSVMVQPDFDHMQDNIVPLKVVVEEVPLKKLDLGLSFSTEDGVGFRFGYDYYNLFHKGYTASTILDVNQYKQKLAWGLSQPRDAKGYFLTSSLGLEHKKLQGIDSTTFSSGLWRARIRNNIDARLGTEFYYENVESDDPTDSISNSYTTLLTASWKRNHIDTKTRPMNGYYVNLKVGTTLGTLLSSASAQRITTDVAYFYTPQQRKYGTWMVRGATGYVHTRHKDVPSPLLFRLGGPDTVRGYANEAIGVKQHKNTVIPGKVMAMGTLEYQYPIKNDFALAVFHDAGDVKDQYRDLKFKHATGLGVRWFSSIAPLSFDIAYGHDTRKIAWYINLGTRF